MSTVLTPSGRYPPSDVIEIPKGARVQHVNDEVHVIDESGSILHRAKGGVRSSESGLRQSRAAETAEEGRNPRDATMIAGAEWTNSDQSLQITALSATWAVPDAPAETNDDTLFLFDSLGNNNKTLMPALQWGKSAAGGGNYWAIACWYISGGTVWHTQLVPVQVGQQLVGAVLLTGKSKVNSLNETKKYNYHTYFGNIAGAQGLQITESEELKTTTVALKAYKADSLVEYPAGSTIFRPINVDTSEGVPEAEWTPSNNNLYHITATVDNQGGFDAEVTIEYDQGTTLKVDANANAQVPFR